MIETFRKFDPDNVFLSPHAYFMVMQYLEGQTLEDAGIDQKITAFNPGL